MKAPELSVVIPSHDRPLRLRWLLNALEEQTLEQERFEVVVAEDSGKETARLMAEHPLARAGVLRHLPHPRGTAPGQMRNAGWREARAPVVVFTDDDCRPPADWLERALAAARRNPGAIVQGATRPDPDESELLYAAPGVHSVSVNPPEPWAQTCNILYPRELLERTGGFGQGLDLAGEDTDLALRAKRTGAPYVGAPEMLTYHAVEPRGWPARIRGAWRWQYVALTVKRNPEFRREFPLRMFWNRAHAALPLALLGLALLPRSRAFALLALPYLYATRPRYGTSARGLLRTVTEFPGKVALDAVEVAGLVRGSVRYRTLFL